MYFFFSFSLSALSLRGRKYNRDWREWKDKFSLPDASKTLIGFFIILLYSGGWEKTEEKRLENKLCHWWVWNLFRGTLKMKLWIINLNSMWSILRLRDLLLIICHNFPEIPNI